MNDKQTYQQIVVGAVIFYQHKALILQRHDSEETLPNMWELPSGKKNNLELISNALIREVQEETGLTVQELKLLNYFEYQIEKEKVITDSLQLNFLTTIDNIQSFKLSSEHQKHAWIQADQVAQYDLTDKCKKTLKLAFETITKDQAPKSNSQQQKTTNKQDNHIITIYCDGGSRGNPGPSAAAFVAVDQHEQVVHEQGRFLETTTNNVAEYQALLMALTWLITQKKSNIKHVTINLDSELLYKQIIGDYRVKALHLIPLYENVITLLTTAKSFFPIELQHQKRAHNKLADQLVNQTLDSHTK